MQNNREVQVQKKIQKWKLKDFPIKMLLNSDYKQKLNFLQYLKLYVK